jgi:hypothetical protein
VVCLLPQAPEQEVWKGNVDLKEFVLLRKTLILVCEAKRRPFTPLTCTANSLRRFVGMGEKETE